MRILIFILTLLPVLVYGQLPSGYSNGTANPIDPVNVPTKRLWLTNDQGLIQSDLSSTPCVPGDRVRVWKPYNSSPGNWWSQSTVARQPYYYEDSNGHGYVYFDGQSASDWYLQEANTAVLQTPVTVFVVASPDTTYNTDRILMYSGTNGDGFGDQNEMHVNVNRSATTFQANMAIVGDLSAIDPVNYLSSLQTSRLYPEIGVFAISLPGDSTEYSTFTNDAKREGPVNFMDLDVADFTATTYLGKPPSALSANRRFRGRLYEILIVDRTMSKDSIRGICSYFMEKYGVATEETVLSRVPEERIITEDQVSQLDGILEWYMANNGYPSNGTSSCTNGQAVARWDDASGNNIDSTQSNASDRPIFRASGGPNNMPYVDFGLTDYLVSKEYNFNYDNFSIFIVCNFDSGTVNDTEPLVHRYDYSQDQWALQGRNAGNAYMIKLTIDSLSLAQAPGTNAYKSTDWQIIEVEYTPSYGGNEYLASINDRYTVVSDNVYNSINHYYRETVIGRRPQVTGYDLEGNIAEIIIVANPTKKHHDYITRYLCNKYQLCNK